MATTEPTPRKTDALLETQLLLIVLQATELPGLARQARKLLRPKAQQAARELLEDREQKVSEPVLRMVNRFLTE
jgi:hypothetical protein